MSTLEPRPRLGAVRSCPSGWGQPGGEPGPARHGPDGPQFGAADW